jgi:hypothetical protein
MIDPPLRLLPWSGQNKNATFVPSRDSHCVINVTSAKPSGGSNDSQWNIHIDWRIVDDDLASLKLDVHFSFVKKVWLEVHRN